MVNKERGVHVHSPILLLAGQPLEKQLWLACWNKSEVFT
jgi:hypothetical protein